MADILSTAYKQQLNKRMINNCESDVTCDQLCGYYNNYLLQIDIKHEEEEKRKKNWTRLINGEGGFLAPVLP